MPRFRSSACNADRSRQGSRGNRLRVAGVRRIARIGESCRARDVLELADNRLQAVDAGAGSSGNSRDSDSDIRLFFALEQRLARNTVLLVVWRVVLFVVLQLPSALTLDYRDKLEAQVPGSVQWAAANPARSGRKQR